MLAVYKLVKGGIKLRFCDIRKYLLGVFVLGLGVGIMLCRMWCLGSISALVLIGLGIWRIIN